MLLVLIGLAITLVIQGIYDQRKINQKMKKIPNSEF